MYRMPLYLAVLALPLLSHANTQAVSPVVIYSGNSADLSHLETEFQVNPRSGQAWVNLVAPRKAFSDELYQRHLSISGLRYDNSTGQILYTAADGSTVVCATRSSREGWLQRSQITPTGQCQIVARQHDGQPLQYNRFQHAQPAQVVFMATPAPVDTQPAS